MGLEVFVRRPATFGAWGGVQSALGQGVAASMPRNESRPPSIGGAAPAAHRNEPRRSLLRGQPALSHELEKKGIAHDLTVLPGPHDQPWLREAGTLEMLLWQDRALG